MQLLQHKGRDVVVNGDQRLWVLLCEAERLKRQGISGVGEPAGCRFTAFADKYRLQPKVGWSRPFGREQTHGA
jgi:hypothetical protein